MQNLGTIGEGFRDYGLENYGLAGLDNETPISWDGVLTGFGAWSDVYGTMQGGGLLAEVTADTVDGLARTPILELALDDYLHVQRSGAPYDGMMALSDTGETYVYDGLSGFFKKFFRRIRKGVRRIARGVRKFARKLIKRLPGGKYLLRFVDKVHKIAMKLVKPLMKFVGPLAKKLAPIAAMIPGYGPVITAGLKMTGKIADLVKRFDVRKDARGRMKFLSPQHAHGFRQALRQAAADERQRRQRIRQRFPRVLPKGSPEHAQRLAQMGVQAMQPFTV